MGLDKITTKFQEALQAAQQLASRSAHAELKSLHVLLALLQQDGGIIVPLLEKAGIDVTKLKANALAALEREPSVQGAAAQPQMSYDLRASLDAADKIREQMGDDFLSVEHFLLGDLESGSPAGKILKDAGLD
ncbi:MAG: type VI secretion system ATPase TssH, partial [Verrucomicrobiae bacterium]|nr:type VI secretion system ATPase TssH [Verrucomicrobiae bacterium]NNJ86635.1 type VI secretion system ATPase TssH [Akkermansiaceae bacterium]